MSTRDYYIQVNGARISYACFSRDAAEASLRYQSMVNLQLAILYVEGISHSVGHCYPRREPMFYIDLAKFEWAKQARVRTEEIA